MRCVKLKPKTDHARYIVERFGSCFRVVAEHEKADRLYFTEGGINIGHQIDNPQIYVVPFEPTTPRNLGARFIAVENDPQFDFEEMPTPKIRRAA